MGSRFIIVPNIAKATRFGHLKILKDPENISEVQVVAVL